MPLKKNKCKNIFPLDFKNNKRKNMSSFYFSKQYV